ncbi:hypothetical protein BH20CHL6_BH20CHL6_17190 [soil metagenome]
MSAIDVRLVDVTKRFGTQVTAVDRIDLEVTDGEFFSLLDPSGCGKTTTLRMIGGFEQPTSGLIELQGQDVTWLPPYKRNVNTVFQNYALFPHLTIFENVAFGLRRKKAVGAEIRKRVAEMLELVEVRGYDWEAQLEAPFAQMVDPRQVAAVIVEPVIGEGGYIVPPPGFLPRLREITRERGVLLIADEIQTGYGRTGRMFAVEHWGVVPDIVVMAKGIASGLPLSGILAPRDLLDRWAPGAHGGTFGGNVVSCAAANATLDVIGDDRGAGARSPEWPGRSGPQPGGREADPGRGAPTPAAGAVGRLVGAGHTHHPAA